MREQRVDIRLDMREPLLACDDVELHNFSQAAAVVARRKTAKERLININLIRRIERAEQILKALVVERRFPADAAVTRREKRRRQERPANAAVKARRDKARHILHDAAADRHEMRIALRRHRRHLLADGKRGRNRLMLLRRLHKEEPPRRTRRQLFPITLIHRSIYDKKRIVLRRQLPKQRERFNKLHTICFEPRFDFHISAPLLLMHRIPHRNNYPVCTGSSCK